MPKDLLRYSYPNEPVPPGYVGIGPSGVTMLLAYDPVWVKRHFPKAGPDGMRYGTCVSYLTSKNGYLFEVYLH